MQYDFNGTSYELDLTCMTQRNKLTGMKRKVVVLELLSDHAVIFRDFAICFNEMDTKSIRAWILSQGGKFQRQWGLSKLKLEAASIYHQSAEFPRLQLKNGLPFPIRGRRKKRDLSKSAALATTVAPCEPDVDPRMVVEQILKDRGDEDLIPMIASVCDISHPALEKQFDAQKDLLPTAKVVLVFHGTTCENAYQISRLGFDHRQNIRCSYGFGNYFAKHARYYLNEAISAKDDHGFSTVLVARILVGDIVTGTQDMKIPPSGKDTAVDNTTSPTIFVTFKDAQSMPLYEVKFNTLK